MAKTEVDNLYRLLSAGELLPGDDDAERQCNEFAVLLQSQLASDGIRDKIKATNRTGPALKTAIICMIYAGDDPKGVPREYLEHAVRNPCNVTEFSYGVSEAVNRVTGPVKAVRAKCMACQGNAESGVRQCTATHCALWPFRMGTNPFFNRMHGAEDEVVETQAEIDQMEAEFERQRQEAEAHANP